MTLSKLTYDMTQMNNLVLLCQMTCHIPLIFEIAPVTAMNKQIFLGFIYLLLEDQILSENTLSSSYVTEASTILKCYQIYMNSNKALEIITKTPRDMNRQLIYKLVRGKSPINGNSVKDKFTCETMAE